MAASYELVFADDIVRDLYYDLADDILEILYWTISDNPQPNWRETFPIWQLARYGDTPSHVAWKVWNGKMHSILYFIDEADHETIIRWCSIDDYHLQMPTGWPF